MNLNWDDCRRLGLSQDAMLALQGCALSDDALCAVEAAWDSDWETAKAMLSGMDALSSLAIMISRIPRAQEMYRQRNIPEEILWDGLRDIGIWCRDHQKKTGSVGLKEWPWISRTLNLEVFRLGRLQYEPRKLTEPICMEEKHYPAGIRVVEVHIPAEEPLETDAVRASLKQSDAFFASCFAGDTPIYHCHSWLVSPKLRDILPETSRIVQFQSLFRVYAITDERQAEERVFGRILDDPAEYPEDSSLQRSLRRYLLDGGQIGMGCGILRN